MKETIGILGIGKLGLCFALNLEHSGYNVVGVDRSPDYVEAINNRSFFSHEPKVNDYLKTARYFKASTNAADIIDADCDLIFIVVATPSTSSGGYDHRQVNRVLDEIAKYGVQEKRRHLIIMCTTMPGYCDEAAKKMETYNYSLSYNPEFIAQGNIMWDQQFPDQVLIGEADEQAGDAIEKVHRNLCRSKPTYCRMSRLSAELCKLATNCFLTTKISFANSIGDLAVKVGAEPDKILAAIGSDSRIGDKYLKYGFGFGGPCFPRDNRALDKFGKDNDYRLHISQATDKVNGAHLNFMFEDWMNRYDEKETIVFDHVSYKKGSILIEESQQLALAVMLANAGRKVRIKDQQAVIEQVQQLHGKLFEYELVN